MIKKMKFRIVKNELQNPKWKQTYRIEEFDGVGWMLHRSPFDSIEEARKREIEILNESGVEFEEVLEEE